MKIGKSLKADNPTEILDIVNEHDEVVDSATRKEIYANGWRNFRVIHAFIVNDEGKLWIPRRAAHKNLYPGGLDYSVAGHVESGETYEEALLKETSEEVNIDLEKGAYREIGRFNPYQHDSYCFQYVFEIKQNEAPEFNRDDFSDAEWLTPTEVLDRKDAGELMKDDMPFIIKTCYLS